MDRRTKLLVALLLFALVAVAGGLWRRFQPAAPTTVAGKAAPQGYRILWSGIIEAAAQHRAVLADAELIPKEMDAAQVQSQGVPRPPIVPTEPSPAPVADAPLADVPPSQQLLIGFSGGEIGETDPCG